MSLRAFSCAFVHSCLAPVLFAGFASNSAAQIPGRPLPRIVQRIDESSRVTLRGNTHPLASAANDRGPAPANLRADRLLLLLERSAQQEAQLQTYIQSVHDPNSPNYRQWLTPAEFGRRFGVSDSDLAAVTQWLTQQGFTVNRVSAARIAIEFSGTVAQVQSAFHTTIHNYVVNGEQHWANASDPQIPSALAPVVAGVVALHNFSPRSQAIRGPSGQFNAFTQRIQPNLTFGNTTNGYTLFAGPADAATIYDTPTTLNANHYGTLYDGTGVTIGIAGDSNIDTTQNDNYCATFGLPAKPTKVVVDGLDPGENGDAIEAYLDTEVSAGIAPGANVVLYTAADTWLNPGLFLAIMRALDDNRVDILNVSFGGCEAAQGTAGNQYIYDIWQQAAAQGISVTVSTGDSGSAGCDNPNTETIASQGLAVNGLASTPYNIAVGGTDFDTLYSNFPSSFTQYVDTTNSMSGHRSALTYIPEEPWNDSTTQNGLIANNYPWDAPPYFLTNNIIAGGGGASSCVTTSGTTCSAGYPLPTWQSSFATSKSGRNLPDVSFLAGNGLYGAVWALCTDQDYVSPTQTQPDCAGTPTTGNNFNVTGVGGTSASAPAFAGMLALAAQKAGGRLGQADYVLYDLAKSKYRTVFQDIDTGNNSVSCSQATPDCIAVNTANIYYLSGFNSQSVYDEATGLGSVDATEMLAYWGSAGATATNSSLTLNGGTSALNLTHGAAVTAQVSVTGSGGTPTGPVALVDSIDPAKLPDSGAIASFPLSSGSADQTVHSLPGGTYSVSAHYGGDPTFAASDSNSIPVTVNPESSSVDLKVRAYFDPATGQQSTTPYYGFIYLVDAQPYGNSASLASPNGTATGTITFTSGSTKLGTAPLASSGIAELQTASLSGGTNALKASFPGDASFQASAGTASFTVTQSVSTLALISNLYDPVNGTTVNLTADFSSSAGKNVLDSLGVAPTGTVTFSDGSTTLGTAPVSGTAGSATSLATATASFSYTALGTGDHYISASYSGDANYAVSSTSSPIEIDVEYAHATVNFTSAATTIKQNQSLLLTATMSAVGSLPKPTGTVSFSAFFNGMTPSWTSADIPVANGTASVTIPPNSLPLGTMYLQALYNGDQYYTWADADTQLQVKSSGTITPTVTLTLPSAPVSGTFPLTVTVSGPSGDPVPTGSVIVPGLGGSYALTSGSVTFNYFGLTQPGPNTVTVTYQGDSTYATTSASGTVTLMGTPSLSFNPSNPTVDATQPLTMTVTVGQITNLPPPTGTVTLSYGSYTSAATAISSGSASITIPANTLPVGSDFLTASYSGDTYYLAATGMKLLSVQTGPPSFSMTGTSPSLSPGSTTNNTSTITLTPAGGFTGQVALTASITNSPSNAEDLPTFSFGNTSPVAINGTGSATATLTIRTFASAAAVLNSPFHPGTRWLVTGGSVLGCVVLLISPTRRRRWRTLLGVLILTLSFAGGVTGCGGSGSSGGSGGRGGTTPGSYTIKITGTSGSLTATTMINVNVL